MEAMAFSHWLSAKKRALSSDCARRKLAYADAQVFCSIWDRKRETNGRKKAISATDGFPFLYPENDAGNMEGGGLFLLL